MKKLFGKENKKVVILTAFFCCIAVIAMAQPGLAEFGDATREVKRSYRSLVVFLHTVGAIAGLVGGLRVYANSQNGKHHIDGQVQGWFLSCIFFQLIAVCIGALYGI